MVDVAREDPPPGALWNIGHLDLQQGALVVMQRRVATENEPAVAVGVYQPLDEAYREGPVASQEDVVLRVFEDPLDLRRSGIIDYDAESSKHAEC